MLTIALLLTAPSTGIFAAPHPQSSASSSVWNINNYQNLITFGDSYTDENRLNYIQANNGTYPPPGTFLPESFNTAGGGRTWPRYVVQYAGSTADDQWQPRLDLYDYAVSGAVCSNLITPREIGSNLPGVLFPSVLEYEVPTYIADQTSIRNDTSQQFFTTSPSATNSIYSLWIGTNDLGVNAFLTDSQVPSKTLSDYTACIYSVFDGLYAAGARVFILMNNIPLDLAPLYANETLNGTDGGPTNQYWPDKPSNKTAIAELMREYTTTVNNVFRYQTPYEAMVADRYPGASWALFDVHKLFENMYANPMQYLNGSQPANVTGYVNQCVDGGAMCEELFSGQSSDSFLWFDQLHPSEQADRVIARTFIDVINGVSEYATYY